jgi:hypothetical protein
MQKLTSCYFDDDIYVQVGELSKIINKSVMQTTRYVKDGIPHRYQDGKKTRLFPVRKCTEWLIMRGVILLDMPVDEDASYEDMDSMEAKRRQDVFKAQLMELDLAKEKGELISIADIKKENERTLIAFRNRALSLPTAVAPTLVGIETVAEVKSTLDTAVYELLNELGRLKDEDI